MPLVSVIIPAYNAEKTVQRTIESVLNQSLTDFEVLVVNDGSTDQTLATVAQISDPRLKVLSFPNRGAAASRNLGFQHSEGQYISFIDADDLWTPDKLEAQVQQLATNPEAAVVYSWTHCIDEADQFIRHCHDIRLNGNVLPYLLLDDFIGSGSNVLIRRQAFIEMGGFEESLTNSEDTDLWIRLAARYPFVNVPKPQILYRISKQSKSSNVLKVELAGLKVIDRAFAQAPADLQYLKPHHLGNHYKNLSYKSLQAPPGQQSPRTTLRFLWNTLKYDPAMVTKPIIYKALLKLAILSLLPKQQANSVLDKFPRLSNTSTFLGYKKTRPELINV